MSIRSTPPPPTTEGSAYRANWARVVLAVIGVTVAPIVIPEFGRHRPLIGAYLALALVNQVLLKKNLGGSARAMAGGIIDVLLLTYLVHRVGSYSTLLVALYVVIGMIMALLYTRRVAYVLAGVAWAAYAAVLLAEALRWLPYAPDAGRWVAPLPPDLGIAVQASLLIAVLLAITTTTVSRLVRAIREHEEELVRLNRQLEEISQRDPLTQLFNRRRLVECIDRELARARRGHPTALLMIDLDGFKRVNDERGHLSGDDLLVGISHAIVKSIRASDLAGRYGGDEFAVVLPDADQQQAKLVAERLVAAIRQAAQQLQPGCAVTASVGVAEVKMADDVKSVLRRADESAYRAKQRGGDGIAIAA
jgi:diguanylate cyclase (GGDEF)-like protein